MKKIMLLLMTCFGLILVQLQAQTDTITLPKNKFKTGAVYVGLGASFPLAGVATVGFYNHHGWGGTTSLNLMWFDAKNRPVDYQGDGIFSSNKIQDDILFFALRMNKEIPAGSPKLRFGIEVGPVYAQSSTAVNFVHQYDLKLFSSNYTYSRVKKNALGLSLRAKLSRRLFRAAYMEFGLDANINSIRSYFGVDMLGTLGSFKD